LQRLQGYERAVLAIARLVHVTKATAAELAAELEPLGSDEVQRRPPPWCRSQLGQQRIEIAIAHSWPISPSAIARSRNRSLSFWNCWRSRADAFVITAGSSSSSKISAISFHDRPR